MIREPKKITVYYDHACPQCVRDRKRYEKLIGDAAEMVCWVDINDNEKTLINSGIDPNKALMELHVRDENGRILSELDAYILLMRKVPRLRPLAWLIGLPLIRPLLSRFYHWQVERRLRCSGRLS